MRQSNLERKMPRQLRGWTGGIMVGVIGVVVLAAASDKARLWLNRGVGKVYGLLHHDSKKDVATAAAAQSANRLGGVR